MLRSSGLDGRGTGGAESRDGWAGWRTIIADLVTWGLLGGRRTIVVNPAHFVGARRMNGQKKVGRNEEGLLEAVEGLAPLLKCAKNFVVVRTDR